MPAASGRTFDDIAGRDGSLIARVAEGAPEDVDRAVAAARRSFDDRRWSDQPPVARKKVLAAGCRFKIVYKHSKKPRNIVLAQSRKANKNLSLTAEHARNFLDCMQSRGLPRCDVEIGHRSTTYANLANIALAAGAHGEHQIVVGAAGDHHL